MTYIILVDETPVAEAPDEAAARLKAIDVQANARCYTDDEFGGAFAVVGFAPASRPHDVVYIAPRPTVPLALIPREFKQFR